MVLSERLVVGIEWSLSLKRRKTITASRVPYGSHPNTIACRPRKLVVLTGYTNGNQMGICTTYHDVARVSDNIRARLKNLKELRRLKVWLRADTLVCE